MTDKVKRKKNRSSVDIEVERQSPTAQKESNSSPTPAAAEGNRKTGTPDYPPGDASIYQAERITGRRVVRGKVQYRVKWFGYSDEETTWEPLSNIGHCKDFIEDYNHRVKQEREARRSKRKEDESVIEISNPVQDSLTAAGTPVSPPKKRARSSASSPQKTLSPSLIPDEEKNESVPEQLAVQDVKGEPLEETHNNVSFASVSESETEEDITRSDEPTVPKPAIELRDACVGTDFNSSNSEDYPHFIPLSSLLRHPDSALADTRGNPVSKRETLLQTHALSELKRIASRAVKVIGVTCKIKATPRREPYAVIHFRASPGPSALTPAASVSNGNAENSSITPAGTDPANKEFVKAFSVQHVRQVMPDKLVVYYQSLANIM